MDAYISMLRMKRTLYALVIAAFGLLPVTATAGTNIYPNRPLPECHQPPPVQVFDECYEVAGTDSFGDPMYVLIKEKTYQDGTCKLSDFEVIDAMDDTSSACPKGVHVGTAQQEVEARQYYPELQ
ncbi:hypothetical protein ACFL0V_04830 [Nanoarchaeota archaeon]